MDKAFFTDNRKKILNKLSSGLIIISAYTQMQRSNDASFKFEQESNFWYLTGINSPDWIVIIDGMSGKEWLIAPAVDDMHKIFDGSLDFEEASDVSGIRNVIPSNESDALFRELAKKHNVVYTIGQPKHSTSFNFAQNPNVKKHQKRLERIFNTVNDCSKDLAELRSIKQPQEITAIRKAVKLTIEAFTQVKNQISDYKHEYEIEADFTHFFRFNGAAGHAYDPIIASGKNACTLHYTDNTTRLSKRQLLLMDVGVRLGGYAADITRTYALSEPTKRQKQVALAVEQAHHDIISLLKPHLKVDEYVKKVDDRMKQALMEVDLLDDMNDSETYRRYFPHAISHGLGIDVHDSLGSPRMFQPGMVLTVEPGIYIPDESIGIRIEDDILITNSGTENLSATLSTGL